jgi:hypothetical protein
VLINRSSLLNEDVIFPRSGGIHGEHQLSGFPDPLLYLTIIRAQATQTQWESVSGET